MTKRKPIGGGVGTNQYAVKYRPIVPVPLISLDLGGEGPQDGRLVCGHVWGTVCEHSVSPPDYHHDHHPDTDSALAVFYDGFLTFFHLAALSFHPSSKVRCKVACHGDIPPAVLLRLATDEDKEVRIGVATNPHSDAQILNELAKDEEPMVRQAVTLHINTSIRTLSLLSRDRKSLVRLGVATNPRTDANTVIRLVGDLDPAVSRTALTHQHCPAHIKVIGILGN